MANTAVFSDPGLSAVPETAVNTNRLLKWCPRFRESNQADSIHLFCFPFAGGGASAFANWTKSFPDHLLISPIQYPGRENRWSEPAFARLSDLVNGLADDLADYWPSRFAFLGHSFGALVAYELARKLKQRGQPTPLRLFLAGARAPHLPLREEINGLPDDDFLAKLREYNGLPDEVLEHHELITTLLPIIKNDFRLLEHHPFQAGEPLAIAMSVFGGLGDSNVSITDLLSWSRETSKAFRGRFFKGDHFFLFNTVSTIAAYVQQDLAACSPQNGR